MKKQEIAAFIEETLKDLFPHPAIPLLHSDPYTLLIAVLLSAQCTDERVNQVTPQLFALANTPQQMIALEVSEIVQIVRPCGLSGRKGKAIWDLSKILIDKHHGKVPASFEALEELPCVGHKTASVVMSQAFHKPAFPVDTHIHRCAKRWGLSSGKNVEQTEKDLKKVFAKEKWNELHLRIIYYARKYCPARGHRIEHCPICKRLSAD
ncbi:MAG: endonuclease III [Chlamydiota bacterium]